jgi:hypothetical protein
VQEQLKSPTGSAVSSPVLKQQLVHQDSSGSMASRLHKLSHNGVGTPPPTSPLPRPPSYVTRAIEESAIPVEITVPDSHGLPPTDIDTDFSCGGLDGDVPLVTQDHSEPSARSGVTESIAETTEAEVSPVPHQRQQPTLSSQPTPSYTVLPRPFRKAASSSNVLGKATPARQAAQAPGNPPRRSVPQQPLEIAKASATAVVDALQAPTQQPRRSSVFTEITPVREASVVIAPALLPSPVVPVSPVLPNRPFPVDATPIVASVTAPSIHSYSDDKFEAVGDSITKPSSEYGDDFEQEADPVPPAALPVIPKQEPVREPPGTRNIRGSSTAMASFGSPRAHITPNTTKHRPVSARRARRRMVTSPTHASEPESPVKPRPRSRSRRRTPQPPCPCPYFPYLLQYR